MSYIDNLIEEKHINPELVLEVLGDSGVNFIPLSIVISAIKHASRTEQNAIRKKLAMIDFVNGDVLPFFKHLAQAIAV